MMNVMYAADENYAEIMVVSIKSMMLTNNWEKIHFYLVEDGISKKSRQPEGILVLCDTLLEERE